MSDDAWLRLIASANVTIRGGKWRRPMQGSGFLESSVEMLSRSFERAVQLQPARFAQLARRFPANTHSDYISALLRALGATTAPDIVPAEKRGAWRGASADATARVLSEISLSSDAGVAQAFCWTIRTRDDVPITPQILARVLAFAEHANPEPNELTIACDQRASECSIDTLEQNALNVVRGSAALAIEAALWRQIDILPHVESTILRLLTDPHPAVRIAALRNCPPVWNLDPSKAVFWIVQAAESDSRVAACRSARDFYNFAFESFREELTPIIREMIHSSVADIAKAGAFQVAARWAFHGCFQTELAECAAGGAPHRQGLAEAFVQLVTDPKYTASCMPHVEQLCNDCERDVRHVLVRVIYDDKFFELGWAPEFLAKFVRSKAFRDDDTHLIWKLRELPGSLEQFADAIFAISDIVVESIRTPDSNESRKNWGIDDLVGLLLRMYDHTSGPGRDAIRQRCLDAWDNLLESHASVAWSLTRGLETAQF